jgi:hypothetical protein
MLANNVPEYDWAASNNATVPERLRACASNETFSGKPVVVPAMVMPPENVPSVSTPEAVSPQGLLGLMGLPPHPPTETAAHAKSGNRRNKKTREADPGIVPPDRITILLLQVGAYFGGART